MRGVGATYYRVSVAPANPAGDPAGPFAPLPAPQWKYWDVSTGIDGRTALGPVSVGGSSDLYRIPFDRVDPLTPNQEWHDGQYHAHLGTQSRPDGRYLVAIEVFDASGDRLRPNGAAGPGTDKPFEFKRWLVPGSTRSEPYAALTHMFWWDNRKAVARITDIRLGHHPSTSECQFLVGHGSETISVGYQAYHPEPDTIQPGFVLHHSLRLRRGLGGPSWWIQNDTGVNVGGPGAVPPHVSQTRTFDDLLGPNLDKCAFSAVLRVHTKTTNGEGHSSFFDAGDQASFAIERITH